LDQFVTVTVTWNSLGYLEQFGLLGTVWVTWNNLGYLEQFRLL